MPVNRAGAVRVRGLDELRASLKELDDAKSFERELKAANYRVADLVVNRAEPKMSGLRGGMGPRAADTLRAMRSGVGARISLGGGVPYALGVEFGAVQNVPRAAGGRTIRGWNQFDPWRGSGPNAGYALFPSIRDSEQQILDVYGDEIDRITGKAFPD